MDAVTDWHVEVRPVPEELTVAYQAEPYRDPWNSVMERLDAATMAQLRELMHGGIGEPDPR